MTETIPFELMSGLIVVNTEVNGTPQRFVVDTGASHTVLTTKTAAALKLEADDISGKTATGAGGGTAVAPIKVHSFTWGDIQLSDITLMRVAMDNVCGLVGADVAGVIGYDILSRFRFTVDYQARHLMLEPIESAKDVR